ncbi:MAG: cupin domain-containing protein [Beijerinckiaceae bacterium]
MPRQIRRVITGHDGRGKAIVVEDANAPNVKVRKVGNLTSTLVWVTDETPVQIDRDGDPSIREIGVAPPPGGSILRIVDFPPAAEAGEVDNSAMLREMGLDANGPGAAPRHGSMHRTRSIDYAIVLEGEIDMLLDDSEVHLAAGDVLIQKATNHAWVNRGDKPCRIAFVLIDATEPSAWKAAKA